MNNNKMNTKKVNNRSLLNFKKILFCTISVCTFLFSMAFVNQPTANLAKNPSNLDPDQKNSLPIKNNSGNTDVLILQVVEHPALNATRQGIEDELKAYGISYRYESAQGNPALASQIAQKFIGNKPSVLVGIGTVATQALASENRLQQIPIVFSSVTDPVKAKLLNNLKHPEGVITGVSNYIPVDEALKFFKKILPNLTKLGVIFNSGEVNSVLLVDEIKAKAEKEGINIITAVANNSTEVIPATRRLTDEVDAIFINNDNTALTAFESITKIALQNKIPVFVSDTDLIMEGALGAYGPNQYKIGQQTGKMIIKIINQTQIKEIPVEFPKDIEKIINAETLKNLNLSLPSNMINSIKIINQPNVNQPLKTIKNSKEKIKDTSSWNNMDQNGN